jgi:hypothetical protein
MSGVSRSKSVGDSWSFKGNSTRRVKVKFELDECRVELNECDFV